MGKKILLADDSITIQKVIELTFSDEDFDVVTVGNGRLALERLPEVRPDIVLCDIIMPERDGYEVCEQIKSSPAWSHLPVLLLTGAFEPFDQERAARAGYDGSLAKPFEPETLIAKVKDLLARAPRPGAVPAVASAPPVTPRPAPAPSFVVAAPSSVLSFTRPPAPVAGSPAAAAASFIPDEPFAALDDTAFAPEPLPDREQAASVLAPMSDAESASLSAPPAPEPEEDDGASTVMFRGNNVAWDVPPAEAPIPAPPVAVAVEPVAEPAVQPEQERPSEAPAAEGEAFDAVLEEDLDFGTPGYTELAGPEPAPEALLAREGPAVEAMEEEPIFPPEITQPPTFARTPGTSGAFAALVREPVDEGAGEAHADALELPQHAAPEPEPAVVSPAFVEPPASATAVAAPELSSTMPQSIDRPVAFEAAAQPGESVWEGEDIAFPEPEPEPVAPPSLEEMTLGEPVSSAETQIPAAEALAAPSVPDTDWTSEGVAGAGVSPGAAEESLEPLEPVTEEEESFSDTDTLVPGHVSAGLPADVSGAPAWAAEPPAPEPEPAAAQPEPAFAGPSGAAAPASMPSSSGPAEAIAEVAAPAPPTEVVEEETFGEALEPAPPAEVETAAAEPGVAPAAAAAPVPVSRDAVPVELVEHIAQRVVAQISEKIIREIAWEVIPDLAETLIKQEIDRLKAELAKL